MSHTHRYYAIPANLAADIPPGIDHQLVSTLFSAARDDCTNCTTAATAQLADHPDSVIFMIAVTLEQIMLGHGDLAPELSDPAAAHVTAPEFRQLASLIIDPMISDRAAGARCQKMTQAERAAAITGALSTLTLAGLS